MSNHWVLLFCSWLKLPPHFYNHVVISDAALINPPPTSVLSVWFLVSSVNRIKKKKREFSVKILCLFVVEAAFALRRFGHFLWTWILVRKLNETFSSVAGKGERAQTRGGGAPEGSHRTDRCCPDMRLRCLTVCPPHLHGALRVSFPVMGRADRHHVTCSSCVNQLACTYHLWPLGELCKQVLFQGLKGQQSFLLKKKKILWVNPIFVVISLRSLWLLSVRSRLGNVSVLLCLF